jgi:hypothetical protein
MAAALKVYMAMASDKVTYLGGCNENQETQMIITATWRFKKICKQKESLDFPFYVIQKDNGELLLLK